MTELQSLHRQVAKHAAGMDDVIEEDMTEDEIVKAMRLAVKKGRCALTIQRETIVRSFISP